MKPEELTSEDVTPIREALEKDLKLRGPNRLKPRMRTRAKVLLALIQFFEENRP